MNIRAIVVDDEPLARDELRFMLGQCEDIEVVGEARNATEAQTLCDDERPDVAFLDLRMPGPDGVALAETLMSSHPELKVVIVSAHDEGALRAFEARVADYLLKPVRLERLRQAVERVRDTGGSTTPGCCSSAPCGSSRACWGKSRHFSYRASAAWPRPPCARGPSPKRRSSSAPPSPGWSSPTAARISRQPGSSST